jgi:quercetin dioxygenase-like cupin family protein
MSFKQWHSHHDEPPILVPAIGLELYVRLPPDASGGTMTAIETINAPGFGPPLHRHAEAEVFRVISGRYLYEVEGKRFYAEAGDVVSVPGGAAHSFLNVGREKSRQFILIIPGLDAVAFFTGLGEVMKQGKPDPDALGAFGQRWGVEFLGPPLKPDA